VWDDPRCLPSSREDALPAKDFLNFIGDKRGSVAITFALASTSLVMVIGCAIDYSRATSLRASLQAVTDSAVLAQVRQAAVLSDANLRTATQNQLNAAFPYGPVTITTFTVGATRTDLQLVTSAASQNTFMKAFGRNTLTVSATSYGRVGNDTFEIAIVIDNSGSMATSAGGASKMQSAKDAANQLIDIMMTSKAAGRTKMSVVPFTLVVNIGSTYSTASWMDTQAKSSIHWTPKGNIDKPTGAYIDKTRFDLFTAMGVAWGGCVEMRPDAWGTNDAAPTTAQPDSLFVPMAAPDEPDDSSSYGGGWSGGWSGGSSSSSYTYPNNYLNDNPYSCSGTDVTTSTQYAKAQSKVCKYISPSGKNLSGGRGPNYNCTAQALTRLSTSTTTLHAAINAMTANGNTNLVEGFMWGWRTLSPNQPFADGRAYTTGGNRKIIVLLTDGMNMWGSASNHNLSLYSAFGYYGNNRLGTGAVDEATARALMDAKTKEACTNAKASGVSVYTVGFSVSTEPIDAAGLSLLKDCATADSMAFVANNSSQIVTVFQKIADDLGNLRLTR
jgi:Flp pilus assembly protein TadG